MKILEKKGFTLIELLIVIAIVAILAVVTVLTINPAELLRQARDSNRISDINTLNTALSTYLSDVSSPSLGTSGTCYLSATSGLAIFGSNGCGFANSYISSSSISVSSSVAINGTGWVPVNFTNISAGSPVARLPLDPLNNWPYVYRYVASTTINGWKLMAVMESLKYTTGNSSSTPANDGGTSSTAYEAGSALSL